MLTKDLLQVEKRRPNIRPQYRDIDEYVGVAEQVIAAYQGGRKRHEIREAVSELETHDTFKLVRGLSTLLERRATFEQQAPVDPKELRQQLYETGPVSDDTEREAAVNAVRDELAADVSAEAVDAAFWADREEHEVLVETPEISAEELLKQYNLSLTQTLLFDANELSFSVSGNYQEIFGMVAYLGLMYTVDEDLTVNVNGPASLFKQTRKYGTALAKLVPAIMKADDWSLKANVETEVAGEQRIYTFELDDEQEHLFPDRSIDVSYDSDVEEDFAKRLAAVKPGWDIEREPTILRTGTTVMIPDFSMVWNGREFYVEVVGFWTPEYLEEKIAKVRQVEADHPMVLAVDGSLNCSEDDFGDVDEVIFYNRQIPVEPFVKRMQQIEEEHVDTELQTLTDQDVSYKTGSEPEPVPIETLADQWGVTLAAARNYVQEHGKGVVVNDRFIPQAVVTAIKEQVDALENPETGEVEAILAPYDLPIEFLKHIGYKLVWPSLDRSDVQITKKEE